MTILRVPVVLAFVSTLVLFSCGSSGNTTNTVALCTKTCDKLTTLCFADAGAFGTTAMTTCASSCTSNTTSTSTSTCTNPSATLAAYQVCVDRVDATCVDFTNCLAAIPSCGGSGTGGSSGGGTGGSSGGGTGGSSGGGTGGSSAGTGGFPGFDGGFPGFDGSIPGFDAGFSGTCMDLLQCCNSMTNAQSKASCLSGYNIYLALGDAACGIAYTGFKQAGECP